MDLEGPIEEAIEVGDALSTALLGDESTPAEPYAAHDKRSDAEAISYHYDLSNEFYRLWLNATWSTPAPTSKPARKT